MKKVINIISVWQKDYKNKRQSKYKKMFEQFNVFYINKIFQRLNKIIYFVI